MRHLTVAIVTALGLSACAVEPPQQAAGPAETAPLAYYTAAPGDVMLLSDRCAAEMCQTASGAPLPAMTELVYLGMRSPTEAVFVRRQVALHSGPVAPTAIPGLFVPERPEVAGNEGDFIAPRDPRRLAAEGREEIVVDPVAGVQFGVEHVLVDITSVTPGRVVYVVSKV